MSHYTKDFFDGLRTAIESPHMKNTLDDSYSFTDNLTSTLTWNGNPVQVVDTSQWLTIAGGEGTPMSDLLSHGYINSGIGGKYISSNASTNNDINVTNFWGEYSRPPIINSTQPISIVEGIDAFIWPIFEEFSGGITPQNKDTAKYGLLRGPVTYTNENDKGDVQSAWIYFISFYVSPGYVLPSVYEKIYPSKTTTDNPNNLPAAYGINYNAQFPYVI